jgi:maltose-binding protein MalE
VGRNPTGGANLVMVADHPQEEKETAWEFIKWMTETEQTIYSSSYTGYLPSRYSAIESDEMLFVRQLLCFSQTVLFLVSRMDSFEHS